MSRDALSKLNCRLLVAVWALNGNATRATVHKKMHTPHARLLSLTAVKTDLKRLVEKGYLTAEIERYPFPKVGARRKLYSLTLAGRRALDDAYKADEEMWAGWPSEEEFVDVKPLAQSADRYIIGVAGRT